MILLENVSKCYQVQTLKKGHIFSYERYKVEALDHISFVIPQGEIVGYIGLNGSGKSTTIKILSGILRPDKGIVRVKGVDPFLSKENCHHIGVVFGQKQQLWVDLPVRDSFEMLKAMYSISREEYIQRMRIINSFLDVESLLDMPSRKLSLGQRMKCEFAASLIHWPQILLLDEPTIGIDLQTRKKILEMLAYLNKEYGITIFLTTHNLSDIETLCRRIIVIDRGKLIYDGLQDKLIRSEQSLCKIIVEVRGGMAASDNDTFAEKGENISAEPPNKFVITYLPGEMDKVLKTILKIQSKYQIVSLTTHERGLEEVIDEICSSKEK